MKYLIKVMEMIVRGILKFFLKYYTIRQRDKPATQNIKLEIDWFQNTGRNSLQNFECALWWLQNFLKDAARAKFLQPPRNKGAC